MPLHAIATRAGPQPSSTVWELQALGGAVKATPEDAAASSNLRTSNAVLVMRANSKDEGVAVAALAQATKTIDALIKEADTTPSFMYRSYVNFLDTDVAAFAANWRRSYYGSDLAGLLVRCATA